MTKKMEDYLTEKEAQQLTGYKRTTLYKCRLSGSVEWTAGTSGRKVRYNKKDLLKLMGL